MRPFAQRQCLFAAICLCLSALVWRTNGASLPFDVLLGRPTDTSIAVSLLATNDLQIYYELGVQSGIYTNQTATVSTTNSVPLVTTFSGLQPNQKYFYRVRYSTNGIAPFNAGNELDLIFAVRDANPRGALELNPHIPGPLAAIIERGMARSRSARYQSALEFRDDLLIFLREYNPQYRRTKLARTMKRLWAEEIESELRLMEEYVVSEADNADLGVNLIADALGPDAAYQRFHPNPGTRSGESALPPANVRPGTARIQTEPDANAEPQQEAGRARRTTRRVPGGSQAYDDSTTPINEDGDTKRR